MESSNSGIHRLNDMLFETVDGRNEGFPFYKLSDSLWLK